MTRVVVAQSCWNAITFELDRVAPREGVVLPLVAIEHRRSPCTPIALADVETLAIAEVRCVPASLQDNALLRVAALPSTDAWADEVVLSAVRRYPRLRAAAYLHSHPFATDHTWPSGGDIDGHMVPLLERNRACGLEASFSFIAVRSPARGGGTCAPDCTSSVARAGGTCAPDCTETQRREGVSGVGWRLPCFAMDGRRRVIELGNAEVVDDADPIIERARAIRAPRYSIRRWRRQVRARGFAVQIDELFDGWTRARVELDAQRVLVVLFPLAGMPPKYFLVDKQRRTSTKLDLTFSLDALEIERLEVAA